MPRPLSTYRFVTTLLIGLAVSALSQAGETPVLNAIQPTGANIAGGNSVLITGTNLSSVTSVTFDGLPATILRQDAGSIFVTAPPHATGTVIVAANGSPGPSFSYHDGWDAGRDFSAVQNPVGAWTYGVAPTLGEPISFDAATTIEGCIDSWSADTFLPVIGRNRSGADCNLFSWTWPAGMIGIHPDNSPKHGVIRFTAPETASYLVEGRFECIDYVVSGTVDVAILHNLANTLWSRNINVSFAPEAFSFVIQLAAGDSLDFTLGNGGNGYNYDQTVLDAKIRPVSVFADGFEDIP